MKTVVKGGDKARCTPRLDRMRFSAKPRRGPEIPAIKGFRVLQDFRPKSQGKIASYARVKKLISETTSCAINVQYKPLQPWLKACIVTVIGDDALGITPEEVERIVVGFRNIQLCLVELALDFDRELGIDRQYVRRFARFGKSRQRDDRGGPEQVRFGSRGSTKVVRCYAKKQLDAYRIELEVHRELLRKFGVNKCQDLYIVASNVFPSHVDFVGVRWGRLARTLTRRFGPKGAEILRETRRRRDELSLRDALRFLAEKGVPNPHRFLKRLEINEDVRAALRRWAKQFYALVGELPTK
jgi:hypothetical protein